VAHKQLKLRSVFRPSLSTFRIFFTASVQSTNAS